MGRKRHPPEQMIRRLREAEDDQARGLTTAEVTWKLEIAEQTNTVGETCELSFSLKWAVVRNFLTGYTGRELLMGKSKGSSIRDEALFYSPRRISTIAGSDSSLRCGAT